MQNINKLYEQYLSILKEFIAIKSVSTDPKYADQIQRAAKFLNDLLTTYGFKTQIITGYGNPLVYAEYKIDPKAPTILVYGHYDVQPANAQEGWYADPFTLYQKNNRLYARGVVDNKGQHLIHIMGVYANIAQDTLKYNVKFVIEGEEETGSGGITRFIKENKDKVSADTILISDGEMPYKPMISVSFRGTVNLSIRIKTAKNTVHSGLYGGVVPSASVEAAKLIARLYNDEYGINIPEFYEGKPSPTPTEVKHSKLVNPYKKKLFKQLGFKRTFTREYPNEALALGFDTTATPTGLSSGYTGKGYANIIPHTAEIKFNLRIPYGQDPKKVAKAFVQGLKRLVPNYVQIEGGEIDDIAYPVKVDITSKWHKKAENLLQQVYQSEVLYDYCGATLPIVYDIKTTLKQDPLLVSLANDDCNMHGVNENYHIDLIKKGLKFSVEWFGGGSL